MFCMKRCALLAGSLTLMVSTTVCLGSCRSEKTCNVGNSSLQGAHQVAQKLRTSFLPLRDSEPIVWPVLSLNSAMSGFELAGQGVFSNCAKAECWVSVKQAATRHTLKEAKVFWGKQAGNLLFIAIP